MSFNAGVLANEVLELTPERGDGYYTVRLVATQGSVAV